MVVRQTGAWKPLRNVLEFAPFPRIRGLCTGGAVVCTRTHARTHPRSRSCTHPRPLLLCTDTDVPAHTCSPPPPRTQTHPHTHTPTHPHTHTPTPTSACTKFGWIVLSFLQLVSIPNFPQITSSMAQTATSAQFLDFQIVCPGILRGLHAQKRGFQSGPSPPFNTPRRPRGAAIVYQHNGADNDIMARCVLLGVPLCLPEISVLFSLTVSAQQSFTLLLCH